MVPVSFAGHEMRALTRGALFWPRRNALLFADLHFEKASWYARSGQMLPPYDSMATLDSVEAVIAETGAREIWCLGDSFHDSDGPARLPADARARLSALTQATDWTWVTGNHDHALAHVTNGVGQADVRPDAMALGGRIVEEALIDGIMLRHEAMAQDSQPEISGHFHPKLRLSLRGRHVARPCFVMGATRMILPAFGALTGGLDAHHPQIRALVGNGAEAMVSTDTRLLRFPLQNFLSRCGTA